MQYYLIAIAVIVLDQLSKLAVKANLELNETIPLVSGIFHITHIQNFGAAFSILENQRTFFIITVSAVTVVLFVVIALKRKIWSRWILFALSLIMGGGVGNLIDRVFQGGVTDFFDFRAINFAIFNVADIAVVCGSILMLWYVIIIEPREAKMKGNDVG